MRQLTTEQFIQKAIKIHGEKYNYSKVIYTTSRSPVIIICPVHGKFKQIPNNHLNGGGCKKCATEQYYNTCIEYDGEQHFFPIFNMDESDMKKRIKNDLIKTKYCQNKSIKLIRINFKEQKNIIEILKKEIYQ